jgi:3-isopropylmalate/(R)-2-methylmalate dehydratase large subunit
LGYTISEKILARASGKEKVEPGEIVKANVDVAMMPDITAVLAFKAMNAMGDDKVWDPEKIVIVLDHVAPPSSINSARVHKEIRNFVSNQGIHNLYDIESGVCHQVLPENGHVKPGTVIIGADSHTCTHGALGAFATGVGSTDMGAVLAKGKIWLKVPESIKVEIEGNLPNMVTPKDLILQVIGEIGVSGATYKALEFTGSVIEKIGIPGRMTICNMAIEMGAKTGIIRPDNKTFNYLKQKTDNAFDPVISDKNAFYEDVYSINVTGLEPQVACPHNVDNVKPVSEVAGTKVNQVFVGSCTNGRLEDIQIVHQFLKGQIVHAGTRVIVVPASRKVFSEALKTGIISDLVEAGVVISNPSCAACFGGHIGILGPGEVGITTSNRNFRGRQGSTEAEVYLSSPAVAAASALTGVITDPREI